MKVTVDIPDVLEYNGKKYRPTGEYKTPRVTDVFFSHLDETLDGGVKFTSNNFRTKRFIYEEVKPWRAEGGGYYWRAFVGFGEVGITQEMEGGYLNNDLAYNANNYFQTEAEAQHAADLIK